MTYFTSGATSHDPEPWAYSRNSKTGPGPFGTPDRAATRFDKAMLWFPRPEFEHDNLILVEFRGDGVPASMYLNWIEGNEIFRADLESDFTPEQIEHARRVLTKLAALQPDPWCAECGTRVGPFSYERDTEICLNCKAALA